MIKLCFQKEEFASESGLVTPKNKNLYWAFGLVAGSWLICLLISGVITLVNRVESSKQVGVAAPKLRLFTSESEFRNYLKNQGGLEHKLMISGGPAELEATTVNDQVERYSDTNVQVKGIDEPDIVKTDGKQIYVSSQNRYFINQAMPEMRAGPLVESTNNTKIVQALPMGDIKKIASVEKGGELLVFDNYLAVFESQKITGFDISDPKQPLQVWEFEFEGNRQIETARLIDNKILVVSKLAVYQSSPCPMPLGRNGTTTITVACTDIWHPEDQAGADTTYTIMKIDPEDGQVETTTTIIGSSSQSVVYVSNQAAYITFSQALSQEEIIVQVIQKPDSTLVDEMIKNKIQQLMNLDISKRAKQVEIDQILNGYTASFSDDDRLKWQTELNNQVEKYKDEHQREIETTTVSMMNLRDWRIGATAAIPGRPLNQFSLDEYDDHLRIATTISGKANDVYVLDSNLNQVGSVLDLGKNERIYAVRFVGKRGFVVTFRETDPLYILDLSIPKAPVVTGELKIPGYSSYLHPLTESLLVGIGKENNQVKVSLFDVSDMLKPTEIDKYLLPDFWSEILSTHHAFLQDDKHQAMFIPASTGGYIFSYGKEKLKLERAVAGKQVKRALYIGEYLYLVSQDEIEVISETNWQTVKTLGL